MQQPFEYVYGENQGSCYQSLQSHCGIVAGFCKGWMPCIGCLCCCCKYPYVTIRQGNKGILKRYNRFVKVLDPGLIYINSITEQIQIVDCRVIVMNLPIQKLMTSDSILISVDSCVYYKIVQPQLALYRLQSIQQSIQKASGNIIKNTISQFTFQQLLQHRNKISHDIEVQIQPIIRHWGLKIQQIFLKDFGISQDLQKQLVSAPVARKLAESKIINAQGDVEVAKLLNNRSKILDSKTAIQVRYLETIKGLARNPASTMMYNSF